MPLFSVAQPVDQEYRTLADGDWPPVCDARRFLEDLWPKVAPFLDRDFPQKAARQFRPHFWELYLASALLEVGAKITPRELRGGRDNGPDFVLDDGTAIEAVLATGGTGADAIKEAPLGVATWVPDDAIRLRLLNAVDEKRRKLERYVQSGVHAASRPFVIAVNASKVPYARSEQQLPRIVRALLPFGPLQVHLNRDTLEVVGSGYSYQPALAKASGAMVPTEGFLTPNMLNGVSAVLYSCVDPLNRAARPGEEFTVVHNPNAHAPIALGMLPAWHEYVVEGDGVRYMPGSLYRDV